MSLGTGLRIRVGQIGNVMNERYHDVIILTVHLIEIALRSFGINNRRTTGKKDIPISPSVVQSQPRWHPTSICSQTLQLYQECECP